MLIAISVLHEKGMIKALKRNQIVIFAIALMLITAGYLNYSMNTEQTAEAWSELNNEQIAGIGDAKLVSNNNAYVNNDTNSLVENNEVSSSNQVNGVSSQSGEVQNNTNESEETAIYEDELGNSKSVASQTSSKVTVDSSKYFSESRIERENMYSEMLESFQIIISNSGSSSEQRYNAQTEISKINGQRNGIMIAENLIKNKGFEDVIIFVNNGSVSVVVRADELTEAEIAQIQSIVQREIGVEAMNIHISNK